MIFSLLVASLSFVACDPIEDREKMTGSITADQIQATVTVEQVNGKNVNKVKFSCSSPISCQWSNGVNVLSASSGELLLFLQGEQMITLTGLNSDGTIVTKEFPVTVDEMYYEVPAEYAMLCGSGSKKWTWDTEVNGGAWGNMGYKADSGENFANNGSGTWWSCAPADLADQLSHSTIGSPTGEENADAYMTWTLSGTKIETFTPSGTLIRSGKFSLNNYSKKEEGWSIGTLTTTAEAILWPWVINWASSPAVHPVAAPTEFEVIQLNEEKMVLVVPPADGSSWSEATFWRFKAK